MDKPTLNFYPNYIHPEEEPDLNELNSNFNNIKKDLEFIDKSLTASSNNFLNLLEKTKLKLNNIKECLKYEKERQQDINILCNKYSEFSSVININEDNINSSLNYSNGIISAPLITEESVSYNIKSIEGNGYEGNKFVYLNENFIENTLSSSNRDYINDGNIATTYEYSRITISNDVDGLPSSFNKDSLEAECSIEISSEQFFNKIMISSDRDDLIVKSVYTSLDGLTYTLDTEYNLSINERQDRYNNPGYIYGSGILAIEPTKHVKIHFKSNGYTDDSIAYVKTFYSNTEKNEIVKKTEKIGSAKRHVISINNIGLYKNQYTKGMLISNELITDPVNCIGLYCNEYINGDYTIDNNVSYFLIINGVEHEIVPMNAYRNGKKIIRTSSQIYQAEHVIYINEKIKSAKLKIVINTANRDITPYLSDVKVLIGGV